MRCNITFGHLIPLAPVSAPCAAHDIMNGTITFLRPRQSKLGATWLALVLHNANGVINGTVTFITSRQSNWDATWLFWSCYAFGTRITWCLWHHQWHHYIPLRCFSGHVTLLVPALTACDANGVISCAFAFLRSRQNEIQPDLSGYVMPLVLASHDTNGTVSCRWHWCQHWYSSQH